MKPPLPATESKFDVRELTMPELQALFADVQAEISRRQEARRSKDEGN